MDPYALLFFLKSLKPPEIPAEMRAQLWRTAYEAKVTADQAQKAAQRQQQAIAVIQAKCGSLFELVTDQSGEFVCRLRDLRTIGAKP